MSRAESRDIGDWAEREVVTTFDRLEPVGDVEDRFFDAQLGDSEVEIKAATRWSPNGSSGRARGRFYVKKKAHTRLLENQGKYLLAVYEEDDDGSREIVATVLVSAGYLDEFLGEWYDSGRAEGEVAKVSWGKVIDPDRVEEGSP